MNEPEVEVTYIDGCNVAVVVGTVVLTDREVVVSTDGAAYWIDARLVITIRPA